MHHFQALNQWYNFIQTQALIHFLNIGNSLFHLIKLSWNREPTCTRVNKACKRQWEVEWKDCWNTLSIALCNVKAMERQDTPRINGKKTRRWMVELGKRRISAIHSQGSPQAFWARNKITCAGGRLMNLRLLCLSHSQPLVNMLSKIICRSECRTFFIPSTGTFDL